MRLKNKNILVTGSTRGIGLAIAEDCAKEGANVIIHGTNQTKVDDVVSQLKKSFEGNFIKNVIRNLEKHSRTM